MRCYLALKAQADRPQAPSSTLRVTCSTGRSRAINPDTHSHEAALKTAPLPR
ncbi:MAG: hypothetical protein ACD_54C01324G0004, partial [uncultured bacterium]